MEPLTYSVAQTARLLGVSTSMLYERLAAGEFPAVRVGHRWLIPRDALDALLAKAVA